MVKTAGFSLCFHMNKLLFPQRFRRISVADNSIGFEAGYAERIFEVFQRPHSAHEYQGTGIGLAFCRKIMQAHS